MATQAGVGLSHHRNPKVAGQQAVEKALESAGLEQAEFIFLFASVGYDQRTLLDTVRKATNFVPLAGCSGEGIIACGETDESEFSVAVMAIRSDDLRFDIGLVHGLLENPNRVGREIGEVIQPKVLADALALFVFTDGVTFNFDRFLEGLEGSLAPERFLPLLGGMSADNLRWENTYQYCNDEIATDGVAFVLCSGNARIQYSVNHGCTALGSERVVTKSEGNLIYEIDHRPVLDILREYVEYRDAEVRRTFVNIPFGFRSPEELRENYDEYAVRVMTDVIHDTGAIRLPTEVPEGSRIWVMRRDVEKMSAGVEWLANDMAERLGGERPSLVFQFDCAGRGNTVLREQEKSQFLRTLQAGVGEDAPWIGFYTYGEISPVGARNVFHNWTAVLAVIY